MAINKNGEAFSAEYQAYYDKRTKEFSDGTKALESLRLVRNQKLKETDWYACSDITMSDDMKTYRQALRDITKHENWPNLEDSDWPTPPSKNY